MVARACSSPSSSASSSSRSSPSSSAPSRAPELPAPKLWGDMKPIVSVKELMRDMLDPAADYIFDSVKVVFGKKGTEVRYVWKIWDVEGEKDKEIKTTDYTTNSFENKVHGHLQLPSDWPKGTYRVEVYINGNLDKTIDYTIE